LRYLANRLPFYYGWIVIAVAFLTMSISVNTRSAFSLLFPPILAEMQWDRGTTAAAFSIGFMTSAVFAPLIGMLLDRFGPRVVMPVAGLIVASGLWLTAHVTEAWELYVSYGILVVGASISISYMGHGAFLPNWFIARRGLALGIAFSGVGFGAVALFPWLQVLIDSPDGWRSACIALAALTVIVVVPLNALFQRYHPRDVGLNADGHTASVAAARDADNVVDADWVATEWTLARALRTSRFWWLFFGCCGALFAWYAVQIHQTRYLLDMGYSSDTAAWALGLVPFCGLAGQIGIGHFSDQWGREWAWTLVCVGFAICYGALLAMPHIEATWLLYVVIGSQGLLGYGLPILISAIPAELFAGRHFGTVFGALSVSAALGPSAGPWLTGVMFDHFGSYQQAFVLGIIVCVCSSICVWMSAPRKVRLVTGRIARLKR
jgi:MFS family permease